MKQFREPFALETADGFPVDGLLPASRTHARRAAGADKKTTSVKPGDTGGKSPKKDVRGS